MNGFNTQYRLQFETDNKSNFESMQALARMCVDGKEPVIRYSGSDESPLIKWISIKERLPEKQLRVIVCNGHGIVNCGWRSYHKDRRGMELWTVGAEPHHANDIKYWMPLPEPPGEE